jgi:galactose mutarotase-like enzyme
MDSSAQGFGVRLAPAAPDSAPLGMREIVLENRFLQAVILPDKGADILRLIYRPMNLDVLWKTPWGLKRPGPGVPSVHQSHAAWMETYPGGWQEIFPNGGSPCIYKGAELGFHGEASMTTWDFETTTTAASAEVRLVTRLARSPFRIHRTMAVTPDQPVLIVRERITNEGDEPMNYMWGHHPAYGEPFLSGDCRIDTGAKNLIADDGYDPPFNPLSLNREYQWPNAERDGKTTDLSRVPPKSQPQALFAYFKDFESGWYAITNTKMGLGVGMTWPTEVFPYAWFWQELSACGGYPWYRAAHTLAIEPFTSFPGQGLVNVMEKTRTQRVLQPGETIAAELRFVFFESTRGVRRIDADGTVHQRES